jgi:hypothetical protein
MTYHAKIVLGNGKEIFWKNGSLNWYKENIIIPVFNGQVVTLDYWGKTRIINMRSVSEVSLYKTKNKIEGTLRDELQLADFETNNCTKEILNKVRKEQSSDESKSLIQKSFSKIENQVFVIMKFGDEELDSAYDGVIEPIISDNGLTAIRVDKIRDSGKINDQILENIAKSKFIISDLTGERPNCYYETGFAHALGKELILTIKEKEKIHFDLAGYRFIIWKTESDLRKKLKEQIISILTNS